MKSKLKIGLLIDQNHIPFWAYEMLKRIIHESYGQIELIIKNKNESNYKTELSNNLFYDKVSFLYRMYRKLDKKVFKSYPDAFQLKNIKEVVNNKVDFIESPCSFKEKLKSEMITNLKSNSIDILIRIGSKNVHSSFSEIAKYGVWGLLSGDPVKFRGEPEGFWEVVKKSDETAISLYVISKNFSEPFYLFTSYSLTDFRSVNRNLNTIYWKGLSFIPDKIQEIYEFGDENFFNQINNVSVYYSNRNHVNPTNLEMLKILFIVFVEKIKNRFNNTLFFYQWILLFNIHNTNEKTTALHKFKKILPPKDRFWADPFIVSRDNKFYIFFEELIFKENKGFISLIEMDDAGNYYRPEKILEKDYHLSYPFMFEDQGVLYMLPETMSNNTIELYKCIDFPRNWELAIVLIDNIKAVDSTIIFKDGKYWLFANVVRNKGASSFDELFIFSSEKLISNKWEGHPQNPVISDVKLSRPAGNFYMRNNELYRPSQNCSKLYGYGMQINKVLEFNEFNYKEKVLESIYPNWDKNILATHTLNREGKLTIIDGLLKRNKFFG